jgi:hypothetical protein
VSDLSGVGTGELLSALTSALFLTQFPQVVGEDVAGRLGDVAAEIRSELDGRPKTSLARYLSREGH